MIICFLQKEWSKATIYLFKLTQPCLSLMVHRIIMWTISLADLNGSNFCQRQQWAAENTYFSQLNTLSKFNQSCLNDDYIWKEVSKSLWWATHMNLEGISKSQMGKRHSSPLVYSTTRLPLPLLKVSVRDLLWKDPLWSSELSITLDTWQKSQIFEFTLIYLLLWLIQKTPQHPAQCSLTSHLSPLIYYSPSLPLSVFVDCASGAQVIHWAETGEEYWWPTCHLFF